MVQRVHVGEHVVGEQHRLCVLQVGAAGHDRLEVRLGLVGEGLLQVGEQVADDPGVFAEIPRFVDVRVGGHHPNG